MGSVRTWPFAGLFYWLAHDEKWDRYGKERSKSTGKDDDHDTRNDRRRNGDPGARRPGREASVRLSGRRGAADLRRAVRAEQGAAHPGAARAGRGARGGRLCALDRQGRLRAGHLRPRRHQCGDGPDRRAVRLDPDRLLHRPGADPPDRQRRLPGGRHRRHHAAVHQAQLSGQAHRGSAARAARGVPHRLQRPARPGRGRPAEGHPVRQGRLFQAEGFPAHRLQAQAQGRHREDQAGDRIDGACQAAAVLHRRRRGQFRQGGERPAARTGQAHRLSDHLDADGARRVSGGRSAMDGHARHARHAGSQHGDARLRRDDLHRRALRRPHHRPARRLLARLQENPCRHRSVLDQQERPRRRADRRRLRACAGRHGAAVAHRRGASRQEGAVDAGGRRSTNGARASRSPIGRPTR